MMSIFLTPYRQIDGNNFIGKITAFLGRLKNVRLKKSFIFDLYIKKKSHIFDVKIYIYIHNPLLSVIIARKLSFTVF